MTSSHLGRTNSHLIRIKDIPVNKEMLRELGALWQKPRGETNFFFFPCPLFHTDNTRWDWQVVPESKEVLQKGEGMWDRRANLKAPSGQSWNNLGSKIIDKWHSIGLKYIYVTSYWCKWFNKWKRDKSSFEDLNNINTPSLWSGVCCCC